MMNLEKFELLKKKDIYAILDGDTDLIEYKNKKYGFPYQRGVDLLEICRNFGLAMESMSRWMYIEALFEYVIFKNQMNKVLQYFFAMNRFENLIELNSRFKNEIKRKCR